MKRFGLVLGLVVAFAGGAARAQVAGGVYQYSKQTVTTTASGTATVPMVLVGENKDRKGFIVWNNGGNSAYASLTYAGTCSASTPDRIISTFTSWEMWGPGVWTGPICAVRNAGTGTYTVKEYW